MRAGLMAAGATFLTFALIAGLGWLIAVHVLIGELLKDSPPADEDDIAHGDRADRNNQTREDG